MKQSNLIELLSLISKIEDMILERELHDFMVEKINDAMKADKIMVVGNIIVSNYKTEGLFLKSKKNQDPDILAFIYTLNPTLTTRFLACVFYVFRIIIH